MSTEYKVLIIPYKVCISGLENGEYKIAPYDAMGPRSPQSRKEPRTSILEYVLYKVPVSLTHSVLSVVYSVEYRPDEW